MVEQTYAVGTGQIILTEWNMADHQMLLLNTSQTETDRDTGRYCKIWKFCGEDFHVTAIEMTTESAGGQAAMWRMCGDHRGKAMRSEQAWSKQWTAEKRERRNKVINLKPRYCPKHQLIHPKLIVFVLPQTYANEVSKLRRIYGDQQYGIHIRFDGIQWQTSCERHRNENRTHTHTHTHQHTRTHTSTHSRKTKLTFRTKSWFSRIINAGPKAFSFSPQRIKF